MIRLKQRKLKRQKTLFQNNFKRSRNRDASPINHCPETPSKVTLKRAKSGSGPAWRPRFLQLETPGRVYFSLSRSQNDRPSEANPER